MDVNNLLESALAPTGAAEGSTNVRAITEKVSALLGVLSGTLEHERALENQSTIWKELYEAEKAKRAQLEDVLAEAQAAAAKATAQNGAPAARHHIHAVASGTQLAARRPVLQGHPIPGSTGDLAHLRQTQEPARSSREGGVVMRLNATRGNGSTAASVAEGSEAAVSGQMKGTRMSKSEFVRVASGSSFMLTHEDAAPLSAAPPLNTGLKQSASRLAQQAQGNGFLQGALTPPTSPQRGKASADEGSDEDDGPGADLSIIDEGVAGVGVTAAAAQAMAGARAWAWLASACGDQAGSWQHVRRAPYQLSAAVPSMPEQSRPRCGTRRDSHVTDSSRSVPGSQHPSHSKAASSMSGRAYGAANGRSAAPPPLQTSPVEALAAHTELESILSGDPPPEEASRAQRVSPAQYPTSPAGRSDGDNGRSGHSYRSADLVFSRGANPESVGLDSSICAEVGGAAMHAEDAAAFAAGRAASRLGSTSLEPDHTPVATMAAECLAKERERESAQAQVASESSRGSLGAGAGAAWRPSMSMRWLQTPQRVLLVAKPSMEIMPHVRKILALLSRNGMQIFIEPALHDRLSREQHSHPPLQLLPCEAVQTAERLEEVVARHQRGKAGSGAQIVTWPQELCNHRTLPCEIVHNLDLVVTMGGDGTVLWTCSLFGSFPVPPVLPIALGSLGFVTTFSVGEAPAVVERVLNGPFPVMVRHRLHARIRRAARTAGDGLPAPGRHAPTPPPDHDPTADEAAGHVALNEVVIDRGMSAFLCSLTVRANGSFVTHVQGDGLIVSTPTGSTAYNLAAGGCMVHPEVPAILFTPICPHSLSFRPVVFPDHVWLTVEVPRESRAEMWCSFDGKDRTRLGPGDSIDIRASRWPVPMISALGATDDWFLSVRDGLHWNQRQMQKGLGK
ncbi:unnamed protein product [Pedinophyceae sp. YPF-701]|nr:unnamed protein product [Pedinophyceae sp. YPF-701]